MTGGVVRRDDRCPCCAGEDEAPWELLCDDCLAAWMAGEFPHECDRPEALR